MPRLTDYPTYYGAVFPLASKVVAGTVYGPTGVEYTGTASVLGTVDPNDQRSVYADAWRYVPNVRDGGFAFGPQRRFAGVTPAAPATGVKMRKANPTQKELVAASATGIGIEGTDQTITVWAKTLSPTYAFEPHRKDVLIVNDDAGAPVERWIIESVKRTMFGAQFVCYCKSSPLNSSEVARV